MAAAITSSRLQLSALFNASRSRPFQRIPALASRRGFRTTSANMVVNNIESRQDFQNLISSPSTASADSKKLVVIDCFATWCGPCVAIAPKIEEYSNKPEYANVGFYKFDVDKLPDVAQELGVRAMPTFAFFRDGQKVDEVVGASPPAIEAAIRKHKD